MPLQRPSAADRTEFGWFFCSEGAPESHTPHFHHSPSPGIPEGCIGQMPTRLMTRCLTTQDRGRCAAFQDR